MLSPDMSTPPVAPFALPPATQRRVHRYRVAAGAIFVLGLACAGVVYWLGSRRVDYSDDPAMLGFNRAAERQMGVLFGTQGVLIGDFDNWIQQPGAQAFLIALAAAVGGLICYLISRLLAFEAEPETPPESARARAPADARSISPAAAGESGRRNEAGDP